MRILSPLNIVLIGFIILGAALHFYRVTEIGMIGDDDFFYWETARQWALGNFILTDHYRPFAYFLFGLSQRIFGVNDWSIKLLNCLLEVVNILIVFLLSKRILKNFSFSLLATLIYAWIPFAFLQTGRDAIHIVSATFMLLTLLTFFKAFKEQIVNKYLLFISGVSLGLTANTHPDLGVLGLSFVIFTAYKDTVIYQEKNWSTKLKKICIHSGLFTTGFLMPFIIVFTSYGIGNVLDSFLTTTDRQTGGGGSLFIKLPTLAYNFLAFSSSSLFVWSLIMGSIFSFYLFKKKNRPIHDFAFFFAMTFVNYLFFYTILISKHMIYRLYFPMIIIPILYFLLTLKSIKVRPLVASGIVGVLLLSFWNFNPLTHHFFPLNRSVSPYKVLSDTLEEYIEKTHTSLGNILVLPLTTYASRTPLTYQVYLEGKGIYMSRLQESSIKEAVEKKDIQYIWWAPAEVRTLELLDRSFFIRSHTFLFGEPPKSDYTPEKEKKLLKDFLKKRKHRVISEQNGLLLELL